MPPLDRVCNLAQYLQDRHGNLTIFQHKIYPPGITQPRLRDDFDKLSCIPPGRPSEGHGSLSSTGPTPSLTMVKMRGASSPVMYRRMAPQNRSNSTHRAFSNVICVKGPVHAAFFFAKKPAYLTHRLSSCPQELARGHQPTPGWYSGVSFS